MSEDIDNKMQVEKINNNNAKDKNKIAQDKDKIGTNNSTHANRIISFLAMKEMRRDENDASNLNSALVMANIIIKIWFNNKKIVN